MELKELLDSAKYDDHYRYCILRGMLGDCRHYLDNGPAHNYRSFLWPRSECEQIIYMKALWNSLPADSKPKWLSYEDIETLEKRMRLHRAIRDYMVFEEETNSRYPYAKYFKDLSLEEMQAIEEHCEGVFSLEAIQCAIAEVIGNNPALSIDEMEAGHE